MIRIRFYGTLSADRQKRRGHPGHVKRKIRGRVELGEVMAEVMRLDHHPPPPGAREPRRHYRAVNTFSQSTCIVPV